MSNSIILLFLRILFQMSEKVSVHVLGPLCFFPTVIFIRSVGDSELPMGVSVTVSVKGCLCLCVSHRL